MIYSFLRVMIYSFLRAMIHTLAQKVDGKQLVIFTHQPMRVQNAFYITHILPVLKSEPMEYLYPKLGDATVHNNSDMSASDYIETEYYDKIDIHAIYVVLCIHSAFR